MGHPIFSVLQLRIVVLTLGETHHAGWWKSQFLSQVGLSFLDRLYPRSAFAAAVRSATRAAQLVHDANVGKGPELERKIDTVLVNHSAKLEKDYLPLLPDRPALLTELAKLTDGAAASAATGPLRLATNSEQWLAVLAAAYAAAFRDGSQVFPYFEEKVRLT
jgi:hypothetical protein